MTESDARALLAKKRGQLAGLKHLRESYGGTSVLVARQRLEAEIAALEVWIRDKGAA